MPFEIAFRAGRPTPSRRRSVSPPERTDDEVLANVLTACELLAEVEGAEFVIRGFGRDPWQVDVWYDMSTFLSQVPELANALRENQPIEVNLFGQGTDAILEFDPQGETLEIRCTSYSDWLPAPDVEIVTTSAFVELLEKLVTDVADGLAHIDDTLISRPPFDRWSTGKL